MQSQLRLRGRVGTWSSPGAGRKSLCRICLQQIKMQWHGHIRHSSDQDADTGRQGTLHQSQQRLHGYTIGLRTLPTQCTTTTAGCAYAAYAMHNQNTLTGRAHCTRASNGYTAILSDSERSLHNAQPQPQDVPNCSCLHTRMLKVRPLSLQNLAETGSSFVR